MKQRILTGAILLLVVVGIFFLRDLSLTIFDVFIATSIIFSVSEVSRVFIRSGRMNFMELAVVYAVTVYLSIIWGINSSFTLAQHLLTQTIILALFFILSYLFTVLQKNQVMNSEDFKKRDITLQEYATKKSLRTLFVMVYPTILLSFLYLINHIKELRLSTVATAYAGVDIALLFLIMTFLVTMATDTFAYFIGSLLKGPKLAPLISPKKTISGAVGGLFGAMLTSVLLFVIFNGNINFNTAFLGAEISIWHFVIYGLLAGVVSQIGDLFASLVKRKARAKDYSSIFPGHGGFMDRLDGVSFNAVFTFVYVMLFFL